MAGAKTTLTLQDRFSGPLQKVINSVQSSIKAMDRMNASAKLDTQHIEKAGGAIQSASAQMDKFAASSKNSMNGASSSQQNLNNEIRAGTSDMVKFGAAILSAVGAYKLIGAAKNYVGGLLKQGIDFHAFKQASASAFTIFLGDAEKAKQYMDEMYAFALTTPFAYPDLLESSRNLIAFGVEAKNTFPLMQSIGDAVAGIGGGNQEIREMADVFGKIQSQGRITGIELERLGVKGINALEILANQAGVTKDAMRKQISKGAVGADQAISALIIGMNEKFGGSMKGLKGTWAGTIDKMKSTARNAGAKMTEALMVKDGPLVKSVESITKLIKKIPEVLGPAIAAFIPLIEVINSALDTNSFDGFFSSLGSAITTLAWIVSTLGIAFVNTAALVGEHWGWIEPILVPIGAALGAIVIGLIAVKTATMAWAAWQWAVNAAYLANPVGLIILVIVAAIALVVYAMHTWAEVSATVIGLIVGSLYFLGAVFYNVAMSMGNIGLIVAEWIANAFIQAIYAIQVALFGFNLLARVIFDAIANTALRVSEFFLNKWNDAVYGVQVAFNAMANFILTIMNGVASGVVATVNMALGAVSNLINGAVSGINSFIGVLNSVLGTDLSTVGTVDLKMGKGASSFISGMQASLAAPVKAPKASLGSYNTAGDYASANAAPKAPGKVSLDRLDYKNPMESFANGVAKGFNGSMAVSEKLQGVSGKINDFAKGIQALGDYAPSEGYDIGEGGPLGGDPNKAKKGKKAKNPTGGKLDKVGKIEKPINIADEDLKMLRDLAEIKAIQNIVTLTPSVQFGDMTIREESDINKIIKKIETYFESEMNNSVDGVILT